jgi:hypothetical protein
VAFTVHKTVLTQESNYFRDIILASSHPIIVVGIEKPIPPTALYHYVKACYFLEACRTEDGSNRTLCDVRRGILNIVGGYTYLTVETATNYVNLLNAAHELMNGTLSSVAQNGFSDFVVEYMAMVTQSFHSPELSEVQKRAMARTLTAFDQAIEPLNHAHVALRSFARHAIADVFVSFPTFWYFDGNAESASPWLVFIVRRTLGQAVNALQGTEVYGIQEQDAWN